MTNRKPPALTARWNKDLTITIYCNGRKIHKTRYTSSKSEMKPFFDGWFGESPHNVRWIYA